MVLQTVDDCTTSARDGRDAKAAFGKQKEAHSFCSLFGEGGLVGGGGCGSGSGLGCVSSYCFSD